MGGNEEWGMARKVRSPEERDRGMPYDGEPLVDSRGEILGCRHKLE